MAQFDVLYGRRCCSPIGWFDPGKARMLSTNLVRDSLKNLKLIDESLQTIQSRKTSYTDKKVRDVAFIEGKNVLVKVFPMSVMRFGKNSKLSLRFIDLFEVL